MAANTFQSSLVGTLYGLVQWRVGTKLSCSSKLLMAGNWCKVAGSKQISSSQVILDSSTPTTITNKNSKAKSSSPRAKPLIIVSRDVETSPLYWRHHEEIDRRATRAMYWWYNWTYKNRHSKYGLLILFDRVLDVYVWPKVLADDFTRKTEKPRHGDIFYSTKVTAKWFLK